MEVNERYESHCYTVMGQVDDMLFELTNDKYGMGVDIAVDSKGKAVEVVTLGLLDGTGDGECIEEYPIYFMLKALMLALEKEGKDIGEIIEKQINEEKKYY